ncbi:MAG: 30S ribosomal protein S16 [Deltaproteobacteria bacterium]|nr:30S ribosomal protein S16 [Deltaproteobacteria bacterium]MBW1718983.1 30S ribosomal protein S16 [Deltaproteobacteria bacterium]MBW1933292.1 30S ribosomal protein S16 [Deltaproteobacteria bacterium]MBW1937812.1 30S ribosomal protein S16 [Deltaproteobacteria bacterium]MBW1964503.1 30S ribosomal protein S16 [Deltaproteobacteria bacterium]
MAIKIRLTRRGRKKKPFYRVVAANSESKRDGKFLEILGTYDPLKDPAEFKVDSSKVDKWLSLGAQPTDTVRSLLKKVGHSLEPARQ